MLEVRGTVQIAIEYRSRFYVLECVVVRNAEYALLGLPSCRELGLVSESTDSVHAVDSNELVFHSYADVCEGLGMLPSTFSLHLKSNCTPVAQHARTVPFLLRQKIKDIIDAMEKNNTIIKRRSYH